MNPKVLLLVASLTLTAFANLHGAEPKRPEYETRSEHDPNGIGKFYLGREIARVMGHQAAGWLERPEREAEERTDLLVEAMELKPGEFVADIGAGSGYFCWRMGKKVAPNGKIFAVDIQQEMLDLLQRNMARHEVSNVASVLGTASDPKLPTASVDTILLVDVYHEFEFPFEMLQSMTQALKKRGRIVWVEFRAEDPSVDIKRVHKMSVEQAIKEASVFSNLHLEKTIDVLPQQHIMIFRKS